MIKFIPTVIAFITFTSYIVFVIKKYGVQKSVSFSDYIQEKPFKMCFEFTMWICGICLFWHASIFNLFLVKIGSVGVFGVGLFTRYKRANWVEFTHYTFAITGFACTLVGLYFNLWSKIDYYSFHVYFIALMVLITALALSKNKIWSIEITLSYLIFIGMIMNLI